MAKSRRVPSSGREGPADDRSPGATGDPLGRLIELYRTNLTGAVVSAAVVGLIGLGVLGYALSRQPRPLTALLVGAFTLLFALWWLVIHLLNAGRRLELRKRGIRFVDGGRETELAWDDVVAVDVDRHDNTNLGVGALHTRGSNATRPSGPFTKTDWNVIIRGAHGETIRLRPSFLRIVRDPRKLIAHLRLRAGLGKD